MWKDVVVLFREYMGTGLIVIWYMTCLAYLWICEERRHIRILFLYTPVILLLFYFNPVFARLVYGVVGEEIYYRILWLFPMTVVIAYTCAHIYGRLARREAGERKADLFALCAAGLIGISGSFIYSSPSFSKAENLYHVPDSVVSICDAIRVPGREVMAAFPLELVSYVRQYSPVVCMPYGREMTVERWIFRSPLSDVMEEEVIDTEKLVRLAREAQCHFCILREDRKTTKPPQEFGWEVFGRMNGYVVYRDPAVELVVPEVIPEK